MAKMSITQAFSKRLRIEAASRRLRIEAASRRLRIEAASRRLRIITEVVLGTSIGDSQTVTDSASITDLFAALLSKLFSDGVGTTDQAIFAIGKGAQDTVSITETTAFDVTKPFSNTYTASDAASVGAGKVASDSFSITDAQIASIGKNPQDTLLLSESQSFDVSKVASDIAITVEVLGLALSKTFTDSVSMTDSVSALMLTLEEAFDAGLVTDTNALTFGKAPQDTAITADIQTFSITKGLSDTVYATDDFGGESTVDDEQTIQVQKRFINFAGITDATVRAAEYQRQFIDNASAADIVVLQADYDRTEAEAITASDVVSLTVGFSRAAADAATIQDNQVALLGKGESDTLGIADSGVLLSQDYVDNNLYFADDYVGEKRTF